MKRVRLFLFAILALVLVGIVWNLKEKNDVEKSVVKRDKTLKLYWFIPDGVRADPDLFKVFDWAKMEQLPNIKKMMDKGSYGYSYPNFPSHTPTNFATLLTGSYPEVHGINDGPMHVVGKPLDSVAVGGFRSTAKKVEPIWKTLENAGLKVALISIPGSTPPEIKDGAVIRGRWGGWGADFPALNFETKGDLGQRIKQGTAARFFYFGPQLTNYTDATKATGWSGFLPTSYSDPLEVQMTGWGSTLYGFIYDSTNNKKVDYDRIAFSLTKDGILSDLKEGEFSSWLPLNLKWTVGDKTLDIPSTASISVIKLEKDGFFRLRVIYDNLNNEIVYPSGLADNLRKVTGPMIDFVDNFPPQLIYYPEDKRVFAKEMELSFGWHFRAVKAVTDEVKPNVVIHDIYSPNQMLTSRWWMGYIDPKSTRYNDKTPKERKQLFEEVRDMYFNLDKMIGEIMSVADNDTYIVFSSDHGNVPLNVNVNLNNLFAQKGWLKFEIDSKTGEPVIDWANSKVIYLKMAHVYINTKGLAGDYKRDSGPEYEKLRDEVIKSLKELSYKDGQKPLTDVVKYENVKEYLQMDPDRAGDLVIANAPGFGWREEMTADKELFSIPLVSGYKQAIKSEKEKGMWTPFIIMGPGIKKNNYLGDEAFPLIDQYPTIMKALGIASPNFVQGKPLPVFE